MWVCLCEGITSTKIREALQAGADSVAAVGQACRAGTVCGKCQRTITILIDEHREQRRLIPWP